MQISSRFSLAIHILLYTDYYQGKKRVTSDALAASTSVNPVIIRNILLKLRDAGLLKAKRGTGGIALQQPLSEITLLDVYRAVGVVPDGKLFKIHEHPNPLCPVGNNIQILLEPRFSAMQQSLESELKNQTLEEMKAELISREEDYSLSGKDKNEIAQMSQEERRIFLIGELQKEIPEYRRHRIPTDEDGQWDLLRSLFNLRPPYEASREFIDIQDALLRDMTLEKGITEAENLDPSSADPRLILWKGDITTLRCDAIVNAANPSLLGCFRPLHPCIDNLIHTMSGVQLRIRCSELMEKQGYEEPVGQAKITPAYNLPSRYVIHTVGPDVINEVTKEDEKGLKSCYRACLELAEQYDIEIIAFCCISTGESGFPAGRAAEIAIETVRGYLDKSGKDMKVIFDVYSDKDYFIYQNLLNRI